MNRINLQNSTRNSSAPLDPQEVINWLRQNQNFLNDSPEVLTFLTPPKRNLDGEVVDFQQKIIEQLKNELADFSLKQRKLVATTQLNRTSQLRLHQALMTLLNAETFAHFIAIITEELSYLLDVDAVGFCIEKNQQSENDENFLGEMETQSQFAPGSLAKLQQLERGEIAALLEGNRVLLRMEVTGDPILYGTRFAELVRSDALIEIKMNNHAPLALLALGARRPGIFHSEQDSQLLEFLGDAIAAMMRNWLKLSE